MAEALPLNKAPRLPLLPQLLPREKRPRRVPRAKGLVFPPPPPPPEPEGDSKDQEGAAPPPQPRCPALGRRRQGQPRPRHVRTIFQPQEKEDEKEKGKGRPHRFRPPAQEQEGRTWCDLCCRFICSDGRRCQG